MTLLRISIQHRNILLSITDVFIHINVFVTQQDIEIVRRIQEALQNVPKPAICLLK